MTSPRRNIKTRDTKWAQNLAKFIASKTNLTPNSISVLSVFFSIIAFIAYCGYIIPVYPHKLQFLLPLIALIAIQLRLLCNLLDGMVAIECGKKSAVGDIFNEFPDRISDSFILIGIGIAGGSCYSFILGIFAALFAMFTAYTRVLGGAIGVNQYFIGPMAKQHRMALITVANIICAACFNVPNINIYLYPIFSIIVILGCIITVYRRIKNIANDLKLKAESQIN